MKKGKVTREKVREGGREEKRGGGKRREEKAREGLRSVPSARGLEGLAQIDDANGRVVSACYTSYTKHGGAGLGRIAISSLGASH